MADTKDTAAKQLIEITECPICLNVFTDPRVLPCIHTFCLECLKRISESAQNAPGDKLPCPLCRKEFLIPADGINGVPKNFFLENLLQYKMTLQMGRVIILCDICSASDESKTGEIPTATMRCLQCQGNYCDGCVKVHQYLKISKDHKLVKLESDAEAPGIRRVQSVKYCFEHIQKALEYYCADCSKIVCVSCFVEKHKSHDCKDIASVDKDFRQTIEKNARKMSNYADELLVMRDSIEKKKADFLRKVVEKENEINERNQELKAMIDRDTKLLLDELSAVKSNQLKKMENEVDITDRSFTMLKGFEDYCTELVSKGSASDICSSYDDLVLRADGFEKDHETFFGRPRKSVEVSFEATDLREILPKFNNNVVGIIHAASLVQGRRRHGAAFIDDVLYICGGLDSNGSVLDSVEAFNAVTVQCKTVGKLVHCVQNSGNCVPFRSSLYIFGGKDKYQKHRKHVQMYNTKHNTCSLLTTPMPRPSFAIRAVLWETFAILVGQKSCFIFDLQAGTWQERDQFKTEVRHFGLVLENERVFVIGGGNRTIDKDGNKTWKLEHDVRYVPLQNILDDKPTEWKIHGKLPKPCFVHAHGVM